MRQHYFAINKAKFIKNRPYRYDAMRAEPTVYRYIKISYGTKGTPAVKLILYSVTDLRLVGYFGSVPTLEAFNTSSTSLTIDHGSGSAYNLNTGYGYKNN